MPAGFDSGVMIRVRARDVPAWARFGSALGSALW